MNQKEINIAIAKDNGWYSIAEYSYYDCNGIDGIAPNTEIKEGFHPSFFRMDIPDYCNNLNVINEVIKNLSDGDSASSNPSHYPRWMFVSNLCKILGIKLFSEGQRVGSINDLFIFATATANQLCEAYLRTKKLWKEDNE